MNSQWSIRKVCLKALVQKKPGIYFTVMSNYKQNSDTDFFFTILQTACSSSPPSSPSQCGGRTHPLHLRNVRGNTWHQEDLKPTVTNMDASFDKLSSWISALEQMSEKSGSSSTRFSPASKSLKTKSESLTPACLHYPVWRGRWSTWEHKILKHPDEEEWPRAGTGEERSTVATERTLLQALLWRLLRGSGWDQSYCRDSLQCCSLRRLLWYRSSQGPTTFPPPPAFLYAQTFFRPENLGLWLRLPQPFLLLSCEFCAMLERIVQNLTPNPQAVDLPCSLSALDAM